MKIMLLHDRPEILGGATLYVNALRRYLEGRGHSCMLAGFSGERSAGREDWHVISKGVRGPWAKKVITKLDIDPFLYQRLRRFIRAHDPHVIHIHNFFSGGNAVLAACAGVPTVHTVHDASICCPLSGRSLTPDGQVCYRYFSFDCRRQGCYSLRVYLEHRMLRESVKRYLLTHSLGRIFVHSPSLAERLKRYGLNPLCLPRYIDTESFPFVPLDPASRRVVFVGYLDDTKGVKELIEAFQMARKKIPKARLDIVGDGPGKVRYMELAAGLKQHIHFYGEVPHDSVAGLYQNAAMVVIPSQVPETGPFTALEAMSTGRAVVASKCGGLVEIIVEGVTGYLVDPYDIKGMAERMTWLLEDPATASELGVHGRELIEAMALKDPFPMIEAEYVNLVETKRSGVSKKGIR